MDESCLHQSHQSFDMVLSSSKGYDNISKIPLKLDLPKILNKSVLIIPNERVYERMDHGKFIQFYEETISYLLNKQKYQSPNQD